MLVCWPVAKTRVPLTGEEGMLRVPALIFSLAWAVSRRAATSFIGFQISEPRAVAAAPGPPPPLRVKERGVCVCGGGCRLAASGLASPCRQPVEANHVLGAKIYSADAQGMKCGAGGGVCMVSSPPYSVLAPSVSVSGGGWRG